MDPEICDGLPIRRVQPYAASAIRGAYGLGLLPVPVRWFASTLFIEITLASEQDAVRYDDYIALWQLEWR